MRFEFDQASIKHCALLSDLTSEEEALPALCSFSSRVFPPKTILGDYRSESEIMGKPCAILHVGLIAAFKKSLSILNYRLTFVSQLSPHGDSTTWHLRATRQA